MDHTKKNLRLALVSLGLVSFGLACANYIHVSVVGQETVDATDESRRARLTAAATPLDNEGGLPNFNDASRLSEALTGFDNVTCDRRRRRRAVRSRRRCAPASRCSRASAA